MTTDKYTRIATLEAQLAEAMKALDLTNEAVSLLRGSVGDIAYPSFYDGPSVEELLDEASRRVREGGKVE